MIELDDSRLLLFAISFCFLASLLWFLRNKVDYKISRVWKLNLVHFSR